MFCSVLIGNMDVFCFKKKIYPAFTAAASGVFGGGHTGSAEAGDRSGHLQQDRRAARLQSLETCAFPSCTAAWLRTAL